MLYTATYNTIEYGVYYFLLGDVINNSVSININGPSIRTRTEFSNTPLMITTQALYLMVTANLKLTE